MISYVQITSIYMIWNDINTLADWWYTYPSEKYESVSWDYEIPNWMEIHKTCSKPTSSLLHLDICVTEFTYDSTCTFRSIFWASQLGPKKNRSTFRPFDSPAFFEILRVIACWHQKHWHLDLVHHRLFVPTCLDFFKGGKRKPVPKTRNQNIAYNIDHCYLTI